MLPGIDDEALEMVLSDAIGNRVNLVAATQVAGSTRTAPWRIEVDGVGGRHSYLLRHGEGCSPTEAVALEAMAANSIPTPHVVWWDEAGEALGVPVLVIDWIEGEPLLPPMLAGEAWATDLYLDTVVALQAITVNDLPAGITEKLRGDGSILDVLEAAHARLGDGEPLYEGAYRRLVDTFPAVPETEFGNGDLWPENMLVREQSLVGVIDWQHAGWSDPIFEFLLTFFLVPDLRDLGIEERYCREKGFDPALLDWYRGVEYFDSLAWVRKIGKPYGPHSAETLSRDLERWLDEHA